MREKYYILRLDDPAKPGFCSFDKMYVGTKASILQVVGNFEKSGSYLGTASAIRSYFNGNSSAEHEIAYKRQKVLVPMVVEAEHKTSFDNYKWTHTNVWGFPYNMKCDFATIHQIIFKHDNKYYRCIRAWLRNLYYEGFGGNWNSLKSGFWGNDSILNVETIPNTNDFTFNNLLYVEEECYEDFQRAINDMYEEEKVELQMICDEIFADG